MVEKMFLRSEHDSKTSSSGVDDVLRVLGGVEVGDLVLNKVFPSLSHLNRRNARQTVLLDIETEEFFHLGATDQ